MSPLPRLKQQEIPFDHPDSSNMFQPSREKPMLATPGAVEVYQHEVIFSCLRVLQGLAKQHDGLDYLQVFEDETKPENLWIIEDGEGGAITALLPSEH